MSDNSHYVNFAQNLDGEAWGGVGSIPLQPQPWHPSGGKPIFSPISHFQSAYCHEYGRISAAFVPGLEITYWM